MVTWDSVDGEVSFDVVSKIERELGVKLPDDFVGCARINSGGYPSLEAFDFEGREEAVFNRLLSFHAESKDYIVKVYNDIRDRLVEGVYPFADDPFGNHICFDYRESKDNPKVVFWDHEVAYEDPEKAITPVCDSFTELLNKLYD
ncbi:SMI1/KNR4 family protein [Camelliibacillus cellulosilyticus]|uniref:SMI1/KNR4 family protein n=1 Tax=Camelliibacillus cellulosilyticus TaxID=2174486 RepID=A0ABV9GQW3_9BACL